MQRSDPMSDPAPVRHTHDDGTEHSHASRLAPEVAGFLQQVEEFAKGLHPEDAAALRRLIRAGMMADPATIESVTADTSGYHWDPFTGYNHTHHTPGTPIRYVAVQASVAVAGPAGYFHLYPWWYPQPL
jgi:hypothetical protein